jgi:glycosyltransferase involved in cell wall biosynthesis
LTLRILHTAHSYPPEISGVAEVVGQISTGLAHKGHEVHLAAARPSGTPQEEVLNGVFVHRFAVKGNAATGMQGDIDGYLRFVCSGPWDVLAMHCAQTWPTDALLPYLNQIGARKVFVGHGFSAFYDVQYQGYFVELAESLKQVDRIVALSELLEEAQLCAKHGLAKPQIIPNGVDLTEWNAPTRRLRKRWKIENRPWILCVSNHSPVKGHAAFFKVIRHVRQHYPDVVGMIIGGYYPAAKWNLGRLGIKGGCWYRCRLAAGLKSEVTLRWDLPREDVVSSIQETDIVVITSRREASPLVILESMAARTPWVSFDVGCVREHTGGFVVNRPDEMADKACQLLADSALRQELGTAGYQRVQKRHTWDEVTTQYEALYQDLLTSRQ